jgi:HptB-dependent secretion and biofilm anti anti-sigma factor
MELDYHVKGTVLVVDMPEGEGRLTSRDIDDFIGQVLGLGTTKIRKIAFDMSRKEFLNSSGLGELVKVKDVFLDKNIELVLIGPTQRVKSLINMVGVDQFFNIVDSEDELS